MSELVTVDAFSRELAEASSVPELKALVDKGEAVIEYMRKSGHFDFDTVRGLAFARCRAVVKAGRLLEEIAPGQGARTDITSESRFRSVITTARLSERLAGYWRAAGKIDDDAFDEWEVKTPDLELPKFSKLYSLGKIANAKTENGPNRTNTVEDLAALADSGQQFGAIYADPPWSFRVYSGKGKARSAENHYDTMTQAEIEALGEHVQRLAAKNSALFLWCVMPQIPEALRVIEAWGFTYKTAAFTWVKRNKSGNGFFWGMGYWTRSNAEICLLATKGSPQRQAKDVEQLIVEQLGRHSAKPERVAERIERLVPGPYLEMFARRGRKDWTTWGNEPDEDLLAERESAA